MITKEQNLRFIGKKSTTRSFGRNKRPHGRAARTQNRY